MREIAAFVPNTVTLFDVRYLNNEREEKPTKKEKYFACFVCGRRFARRYTRQMHLRMHTDEDFACPIEGCGRVFRTRLGFKNHKRTGHEEVERLECPEPGCGKTFAEKRQRTRHYKSQHQQLGTTHTCPVPDCGKKYIKFYSLRMHMGVVHRLLLEDPTPAAQPTTASSSAASSSATQPTVDEGEEVIYCF
ncbi:hypothetical protein PRIC1_004288 [Phytophthora ramorum]